jgi:hypothetical protein
MYEFQPVWLVFDGVVLICRRDMNGRCSVVMYPADPVAIPSVPRKKQIPKSPSTKRVADDKTPPHHRRTALIRTLQVLVGKVRPCRQWYCSNWWP